MFLAIICIYIWSKTLTPSNNRNWEVDQAVLPRAVFNGDFVTIENIRNFTYGPNGEFIPAYYDKTFNLNDIESIDYFYEPFPSFVVAHPVASFGFKNGDKIALSIEIRTTKNQISSFIKGLFNQYEITYTFVDERDILVARSINAGHPVYLYPLSNAKKEDIKIAFVNTLKRVNELYDTPEFYNTFFNNCANKLFSYINYAFPDKKLSSWKIFIPKYSDSYIYDEGLVDTSIPFKDTKIRANISDAIRNHKADPNFSALIRARQNQ